jgi:hypothetical protein
MSSGMACSADGTTWLKLTCQIYLDPKTSTKPPAGLTDNAPFKPEYFGDPCFWSAYTKTEPVDSSARTAAAGALVSN